MSMMMDQTAYKAIQTDIDKAAGRQAGVCLCGVCAVAASSRRQPACLPAGRPAGVLLLAGGAQHGQPEDPRRW